MEEAAAVRGVSRDVWIGLASSALAIAAMAVDHLLGEDDADSGLVDPPAFVITVVLSVLVAAWLFGRVVPRANARGPERAARLGLVLGALSVLPGIALLWLGFPFVVAGAGIALGIAGLASGRRGEAIAAVVLAALLTVVGTGLYVVGAVERLT